MTKDPNKAERLSHMLEDMVSLIGEREVNRIIAGNSLRSSHSGLEALEIEFYQGIDDSIRRKLETGWSYPEAFNYAVRSHPDWVTREVAKQELGYYENLAEPDMEIIRFLEEKADR